MALAPWIIFAVAGAIRLAVRPLDLPDPHPNDPSPIETGMFLAPYVLGALAMAWHYRCDAIVVNDEGITKFSARGIRSIAWPEVESYRYSGSGAVLRGGGTVISFSETITGFPDLFREIPRRAVNSRNKTWNTVPKGHGLDDLADANHPWSG
jgi:hypothetical protein